jgi:predicted anti-sigma-YlaC factor YlaD
MSNCEHFETSLSVLIDGELESAELAPTIDHLVRCASCRAFYRDARALDEMVLDSAAVSVVAPPSDAIWSRIRVESDLRPPARSVRGARWSVWAAVAASTFLVAVGLWAVTIRTSGRVTPAETGPVVVVLGQEAGRMSDERFVELATELLRADPQYHRRMLEVMDLVTQEPVEREGSVERRRGDVRRKPATGEDREALVETAVLRGQS